MQAKKSLGQNFLMHAQTAERIAEAAGLSKEDTVLEIGPGTGMLTRALLARARRVVAVEADASLVDTLKDTFSAECREGRLVLIHEDIRLFSPASIEGPYALVANIPYYITGEIFRHFLSAPHKPRSITVLVQKEVAERIARAKKESILSVSIKVYGTPKYVFTVPRGAFVPAPNVDSAVLHIKDIQKDTFDSPESELWFFEVLKAGFAHKRKLLRGNLSILKDTKTIEDALSRAHIPLRARAEDVSTPSWVSLASFLAN